MQPVHKASLLKQVRKAGVWEGYMAPNKVNSAHITGGWHIGTGIRIELAAMHDRPAKYVVTTQGQRVELERYLNEWLHYNVPELGTRVRFWQ